MFTVTYQVLFLIVVGVFIYFYIWKRPLEDDFGTAVQGLHPFEDVGQGGLKNPPEYYAEKYKHSLMKMAEAIALESKAVNKKVGCVVYLNNHTLSLGLNGMPSGSSTERCEDTFGKTYPMVLHAEHNCLDKLYRASQKHLLQGAVLFVTMSPCEDCAYKIIQAGISKVYYKDPYKTLAGINNLLYAGVQVEQLDGDYDLSVN